MCVSVCVHVFLTGLVPCRVRFVFFLSVYPMCLVAMGSGAVSGELACKCHSTEKAQDLVT